MIPDWLWQNVVGGIVATIVIWVVAKIYPVLSRYFPKFRWVIEAWSDLLVKYGQKVYLPVFGIVIVGILTGWVIGSWQAPKLIVIPTVTPTITKVIGEPVPFDNWVAFVQDRTGKRVDIKHGLIKSGNIDGWQTDVITTTTIYLNSETIEGNNYRRNLVFEWPQPLKDIPYSGILARIYIEPNSENGKDRIICNFETKYIINDDHEVFYYGNDVYIPYNEWTTMIWEFSGVFYPDNSDNWKSTWNTLITQLHEKGHGYIGMAKRSGDEMLSGAIDSKQKNIEWVPHVEAIRVKCYVSANWPYTNLPKTEFTGNFSLSTVRVLPVTYPGLP